MRISPSGCILLAFISYCPRTYASHALHKRLFDSFKDAEGIKQAKEASIAFTDPQSSTSFASSTFHYGSQPHTFVTNDASKSGPLNIQGSNPKAHLPKPEGDPVHVGNSFDPVETPHPTLTTDSAAFSHPGLLEYGGQIFHSIWLKLKWRYERIGNYRLFSLFKGRKRFFSHPSKIERIANNLPDDPEAIHSFLQPHLEKMARSPGFNSEVAGPQITSILLEMKQHLAQQDILLLKDRHAVLVKSISPHIRNGDQRDIAEMVSRTWADHQSRQLIAAQQGITRILPLKYKNMASLHGVLGPRNILGPVYKSLLKQHPLKLPYNFEPDAFVDELADLSTEYASLISFIDKMSNAKALRTPLPPFPVDSIKKIANFATKYQTQLKDHGGVQALSDLILKSSVHQSVRADLLYPKGPAGLELMIQELHGVGRDPGQVFTPERTSERLRTSPTPAAHGALNTAHALATETLHTRVIEAVKAKELLDQLAEHVPPAHLDNFIKALRKTHT